MDAAEVVKGPSLGKGETKLRTDFERTRVPIAARSRRCVSRCLIIRPDNAVANEQGRRTRCEGEIVDGHCYLGAS